MTFRGKILTSLAHKSGKVPVDFGSTSISGMHVTIVEGLRKHYSLEERPVRVTEPYQMLGDIESDLADAIGVDTVPIGRHSSMFGFPITDWKEWIAPWGQKLEVPGQFNALETSRGIFMSPKGNTSLPPSACMPKSGFFFDALDRQGDIDEDNLNLEDNLEEFTELGDEDVRKWKEDADKIRAEGSNRAVVAHLPRKE